MSLSAVDRELLQRCLDREQRAWQQFVDRFVGLVIHVVQRTAASRGTPLTEATRDDLVAEVFLALIRDDFAVLRRFRRQCSLVTYLAVIARRVVVRQLVKQQPPSGTLTNQSDALDQTPVAAGPGVANRQSVPAGGDGVQVQRIADREQVESLLTRLDSREANVVRMYHLEGKSYHEISQAVGVNENSIGPLLHRARQKLTPDTPRQVN